MTNRKKKKNDLSSLASLLASTGLGVIEETETTVAKAPAAPRGRPSRAEEAATCRLEFRVSPAERARIEQLLRKRGGSLSGLVRELLAAEADRLGGAS